MPAPVLTLGPMTSYLPWGPPFRICSPVQLPMDFSAPASQRPPKPLRGTVIIAIAPLDVLQAALSPTIEDKRLPVLAGKGEGGRG